MTRKETRIIRKAAVMALALALLYAGISLAAGGDWRIKVREAAIVSGDWVRLGEIAVPIGPAVDKARWAQLALVELWPTPKRALRPAAINKMRLRKELSIYLGKEADRCMLPDKLALQKGGKVLMRPDLERRINDAFRPATASIKGELKLRDFRTPEYMFLSDPTNDVKVQFASGLEPGRVNLKLVEVDLSGKERRKVSASVLLDVWRAVPVAGEPLNRGEELTPDKISYERKNLSYLHDDLWDGKGGPWRITRPIGRGGVIERSSMEPLPLVRRGDFVQMVYNGKHIRLKVPAEVISEGGYSDRVKVRNTETNIEVYAWVVDAHTVEAGRMN